MLKFYFHATPNPMKVALLLEELQLPFELIGVDIFKGEQHSPEYRRINPIRPVSRAGAGLERPADFQNGVRRRGSQSIVSAELRRADVSSWRLRFESSMGLMFHGSSASTASTVNAEGRFSNG
jgi:hypothetical protein